MDNVRMYVLVCFVICVLFLCVPVVLCACLREGSSGGLWWTYKTFASNVSCRVTDVQYAKLCLCVCMDDMCMHLLFYVWLFTHAKACSMACVSSSLPFGFLTLPFSLICLSFFSYPLIPFSSSYHQYSSMVTAPPAEQSTSASISPAPTSLQGHTTQAAAASSVIAASSSSSISSVSAPAVAGASASAGFSLPGEIMDEEEEMEAGDIGSAAPEPQVHYKVAYTHSHA